MRLKGHKLKVVSIKPMSFEIECSCGWSGSLLCCSGKPSPDWRPRMAAAAKKMFQEHLKERADAGRQMTTMSERVLSKLTRVR